jgi:Na+-transporting methylmalonyl-CoA/oxaloacetate decarboxylase gamma subunit
MGGRTEGNGHSSWKILIGLSVLCAALVLLGGFLHRRALDSAIAERQARSVAFVNVKVADAIHGVDLDKPLKDAEAAQLTKKLGVLAGTDVRLFSMAGVPLYGTPGSGSFPADAEGIQAAAAGDQGRVVDGADLRVYTPVRGQGQKPVAIAAVISNYTQLRNDASGPLDAARLQVVGLGIVFLVAGLLLMLQATKGAGSTAKAAVKEAPKGAPKAVAQSPSKRRVTGFDPVPVTTSAAEAPAEVEQAVAEQAASEPEVPEVAEPAAPKTIFGIRLGSKKGSAQVETAPPAKAKRVLFGRKAAAEETASGPASDKAASALDREVAIRQALEDQLEQLRTRIQMQEVETNTATQELLGQIEAANRRAEEAEARLVDGADGEAPVSPPAPPASPDADARVQQVERELAEARSLTADAIARADALQRQVDEAAAAPAPTVDPGMATKFEEAVAQLADAQQRASAAEQRAASVESVRDELEVRVAQLGTKASDLEQRATELETSLNEANAGGDAVRAEIATLTAALTAANARVDELEAMPAPSAPSNDEDRAEIARLRGELANHMERAQVAEERAATLEADVLAAEHGVRALHVDDPGAVPDQTTPDPERDPIEPVRSDAFVAATSEPRPESEPGPQLEPEQEPESEPQPTRVETPAPAYVSNDDEMIEAGTASAAAESHPDTASQLETPAAERAVPEPREPAFARTSGPEPTPEPAAPIVAWRVPSPTESETAASTNGGGVPPAPSDEARYDDIWTAAFAPPQQADEPEAVEPQASQPKEAEPEAVEPQASQPMEAEPEAAEPEAAQPQAEPSAYAVPAEPGPDVAAEDRPAPPEDEVSAEDDMWSLRARLAQAAAKKHPPRSLT